MLGDDQNRKMSSEEFTNAVGDIKAGRVYTSPGGRTAKDREQLDFIWKAEGDGSDVSTIGIENEDEINHKQASQDAEITALRDRINELEQNLTSASTSYTERSAADHGLVAVKDKVIEGKDQRIRELEAENAELKDNASHFEEHLNAIRQSNDATNGSQTAAPENTNDTGDGPISNTETDTNTAGATIDGTTPVNEKSAHEDPTVDKPVDETVNGVEVHGTGNSPAATNRAVVDESGQGPQQQASEVGDSAPDSAHDDPQPGIGAVDADTVVDSATGTRSRRTR